MTCITAVIVEKGVNFDTTIYMAGDRNARSGNMLLPDSITKVFNFGGRIAIGCDGDAVMIQAVQDCVGHSQLNEEGIKEESAQTTINEMVNFIFEHLRSLGFKSEKHPKGFDNISLLIGFDGTLYRVFSDGSILKINRKYHAIGSGGEVALGALECIKRTRGFVPTDPGVAIDCASRHILGLDGKIDVISVGA